MLERFFKYRSVLSRHKNAPFVEERERYLTHKEKEGYAQGTLERIARELFWVAQESGGVTLSRPRVGCRTFRISVIFPAPLFGRVTLSPPGMTGKKLSPPCRCGWALKREQTMCTPARNSR